MTRPTFRETNRSRLRDALLDAARELTVNRGWDGVRVADVAAAVGVSRQTFYNEFDGKTGLANALTEREISRFLGAVQDCLRSSSGDLRTAAHRALTFALTEAAGNPLVMAILGGSPEGSRDLLPSLTIRSETVVSAGTEAVRSWASGYLPGLDPAVIATAAETIVRLTVSHIVLPRHSIELTAATLTDVLDCLVRPPGA